MPANNYDFLDAHGSILTGRSSVTSGSAQEPYIIISTMPAVTFSGSVQTISSVSGTVGASIVGQLPAGTAVLGSVMVLQGTNPWNISSVYGNFSGSVITQQSGTVISSVVNSTPSSLLTGASIFGMLPAGTQVLGSMAVLQGTNPWITNSANSSIIAINSGSVITIPVGSTIVYLQAPSIVGTYSEDAGHTSADKGLFVLGVRNDAVASFTSANLEYNPFAHDSAGRVLTKPFSPEESRIEGYVSTTNTSITTLVPAAGAGLRNYITDIWIANTGAAATLVTFSSGGGSSVLGYTIAPAGGGSNLPGLLTPIRTEANATFGIQAATPTSTLYATVKGFKAP